LPLLFLGGLGTDAEIYHRATVAWLGGGSPWDATSAWGGNVYHFSALPSAVVLMAPFALVPEQLFVPGFVALQAGAAIYVIRRLHLAWWWLLFPPVALGIVAGNPSLLLLALLLAPHDILKFLAPTLKVYAVLPLLGERRWRPIAIAALFGLASFVIAPGRVITNAHVVAGVTQGPEVFTSALDGGIGRRLQRVPEPCPPAVGGHRRVRFGAV